MNSGPVLRGAKDFTDYKFILSEIERIVAMSPEENIRFIQSEGFQAIWFDRRSIMIGSAAAQRFDQIVDRALKNSPIRAAKADRKQLIQKLREKFGGIFLDGKELTETNAGQLVSSVLAELETSYKALTHYIPCFVVWNKTVPEFAVGPVTYRLSKDFAAIYSAMIERNGKNEQGNWLTEKSKAFLDEGTWVATVRIEPASKPRSIGRAETCVQQTLDLIKLLLGRERAQFIRQVSDHAAPIEVCHLASDDEGSLLPRSESRMQDAIVPDDWFVQISAIWPWKLAESIIQSDLREWKEPIEGDRRFLAALRIHGDAISEPDHQAAVVKHWTAIEFTASLRHRDDVTRRSAALACEATNGPFVPQFKACQRLYGKRSDIIHGTARFTSGDLNALRAEVESLSQKVILGFLKLHARVTSDSKELTRDELKTIYDDLDRTSKAAEVEANEAAK